MRSCPVQLRLIGLNLLVWFGLSSISLVAQPTPRPHWKLKKANRLTAKGYFIGTESTIMLPEGLVPLYPDFSKSFKQSQAELKSLIRKRQTEANPHKKVEHYHSCIQLRQHYIETLTTMYQELAAAHDLVRLFHLDLAETRQHTIEERVSFDEAAALLAETKPAIYLKQTGWTDVRWPENLPAEVASYLSLSLKAIADQPTLEAKKRHWAALEKDLEGYRKEHIYLARDLAGTLGATAKAAQETLAGIKAKLLPQLQICTKKAQEANKLDLIYLESIQTATESRSLLETVPESSVNSNH